MLDCSWFWYFNANSFSVLVPVDQFINFLLQSCALQMSTILSFVGQHFLLFISSSFQRWLKFYAVYQLLMNKIIHLSSWKILHIIRTFPSFNQQLYPSLIPESCASLPLFFSLVIQLLRFSSMLSLTVIF